ncbi:MAG: CoA-binding protein [Pseudomonadota bacterium]
MTDAFADEQYDDADIRRILKTTSTVAMVGASTNENRPSFFVLKYLLEKGYHVIPVNPGAAGKEILGQTVVASLDEIDEDVDMVDVFRPSSATPDIARDAVAIGAKTLWLQLGVFNDEAATIARDAGLDVIMNRCPKIEYGRLCGEAGWMGLNSGTLSARRGAMLPGMQRRKLR